MCCGPGVLWAWCAMRPTIPLFFGLLVGLFSCFFFFLRCLFLLLPFANVSVMFFFLKKKIVHFVISL